jgi:hypothetical protein
LLLSRAKTAKSVCEVKAKSGFGQIGYLIWHF